MTTPINNFQDILDAMERDPALRDALRRHILTDELLQVPVRLDRIEGDIGALKEGQTRLEEGQARLEVRVDRLDEKVDQLDEKVDRLDKKVDQLDKKVDQLDGKVDQLEGRFDQLEMKVDKIGGDVSRLTGADYESHVATYVHRFLRRGLGINATVFSTQRDKSDLTRLLDGAESRGLIEPKDTDELDKADLILSADSPTDYLLAEISITVQQDDVDRASERARLLAKATAQTVTPFAIGTKEEPDLRRGLVQVVLVPERQLQPQTP